MFLCFTLMVERRFSGVEVPWRLRNVLCDAYQTFNSIRDRCLVDLRGIWGLMGRPSSSSSAAAVPAFRAASSSF